MIDSFELHIIGCVLKLRCKMGARLFRELGWWRSVLVAGMVLVFGPALVAGLHRQRKDAYFVETLGINKQKLYTIEYLIASCPVIMVLSFAGIWEGLLGLIPGCFILARIPVRPETAVVPSATRQIPLSLPYEWASGLRTYKWTLAVLVLVGLLLTWFNLFAGWVCVFFITATVAFFYQYCEPVSLILLQQNSPGIFITRKIVQGVVCYGLLTSLLWIEMIVWHPEYMLYTFLFLLCNVVLLITIIMGKYAFYREHLQINVMISLLFLVGSMCLLVPYMPPVLCLLIAWLWMRATNRLKQEVYAFH